ncbi:UNVERIFIED_CONTAM: hypothetical protein PYX00_010288 [Menopon gallinae]|uniref:Rho GTPase-activating protein 21 n=1 Tax=Menopon gallinae TaxID=328185 RepID=A0AAW2HET6_9NEOP
MGDPGQTRQQPAPQTPARNKNRGPRSLWIDRWENSFGFRLRHFIVYPPESYKLLARDKGFGLSQPGSSSLDEAMDTMFVMVVQRGSPAEAAGLVVGDRIVSINGSTVAGKSYAEVVQQIQKTPDRLHLLVVPGEEDIIQQYYRDTAHNPKTNVRPRLKSPEVLAEQRRAVPVSTTPQRTTISPKIARTTIMQQQPHPINVVQPGVPYIENEPIYNQLTWPDQKIGSENRGTFERLHVKTQLSRCSSDSSNKQAEPVSVIKPTSPNPSAFYPNSSGCRLSLDGGMLDRRESSSSSTLTDDSVIMSRIRKSCEQKEEFLRNTVKPTYPHIIAREFYARPQKLQKPVWPPQSPEPEVPGAAKAGANDERQVPPQSGKQLLRTLSRIHESSSPGYDSGSLETDLDEVTTPDSCVSRSQSEESETVRRSVTQPKLHIVSRRAKQFETGQLEEENRTNFYKSELSRLSGKRNVPNVAVRKQEFEQRVSRGERKPTARESRPQESAKNDGTLSGNRTVIVGSKTLHVEPPTDFTQLEPEVSEEDLTPKSRPRSNSVDSWSSKDGDHSTRRSLHGASIDRAKDEEKQRHRAVRQDSYLAAVKTISSNNVPANTVPITTTPPEVVRRQRKSSPLSTEDERSTRRVSYLKATSSDQMNVDTDSEQSAAVQKSHRKWMYPMLPGEIQRLRRIFEEYSGILESSGGEPPPRRKLVDGAKPDEENLKVIKDGWLNCKVALIDGKRAADRSWKQIWAVLRGPFFTMQKDKQVEQFEQTVDIRSCNVDVPLDYTKRKNVLRLKTETETEYLLQAEDIGEMEQWMKVLEEQCETGSNLSPQAAQKGLKKLSTLRTRSPTGQSPASKNRKPSQQYQIPSPKSKTWKGKLGKQFRKMHQGSGSPSSPTITYPEGATIKVPLELCPPSVGSEFIPLIVERCTAIVEARGLDIVGIYRVPGNTAAVTALTEAVNKGIELIDPEDPRWNDVNVISSLLKSFFRNLPDCLFTSDLYPKFIAADKITDPKFRMVTLRKLLNELPEHNYETLRHMLFHLKKIVSNSSVNKMETRNLAIVFGPTLLSTGDLMSLVTDTSHQCRIVESLISHVDWFFSTEDVEALDNLVLPMPTESQSTESPSNASLLLGNIRKVEGYRGEHFTKQGHVAHGYCLVNNISC